jgi:glucose/arabinose dehydrogenase
MADPPIKATLFVNGLSSPTDFAAPPGDSTRVFITEQSTARVRLVLNGVLQATPFLNIGSIVGSGSERGLLGIAFHPNYASNRQFYVSYTDNSGRSVVRQYLRDAGNPNIADAGSAVTIVGPLTQPFSNHNGGGIEFGPDGMLYYGLGDGGSANDPGNRSQNLTNILGKMLRLDVDGVSPYVPVDNPYIGAPLDPTNVIDDRIWARGLRNPWRFSFDRATGDLYIGDVGQNAREEIDIQLASSTGAENYGWRCMEADLCTGLSGCTCFAASLTDPIFTVSLTAGNCSVTGGHVYRGSAIPGLQGRYFFGDYCSGRVWSIRYDSATGTAVGFTTHSGALAIPGVENISSFGEDADGELYIVDQNGGEIWKIEHDCTTPADCHQSFCDGNDLSLNDCPCANPGSPDSGCDIQQATGGVELTAIDQDTINTRITLQGTGFPPANTPTAIVIRATSLNSSGPVTFGDGLRCIGVPVVRLGATFASGGTATHIFGHGAGAGAFYYQEWFRNTPAMFCTPDAFNLSNGVGAIW